MLCPTSFAYTIERTPEGEYAARLRALPECRPVGITIEVLLGKLEDEIVAAIEDFLKSHEPSELDHRAHAGEGLHRLNTSHAVKLQFIALMRRQKVGVSEMARLLGCRPQEVSRLMKLSHPTKIDPLVEAIEKLGGRLHFEVLPPEVL